MPEQCSDCIYYTSHGTEGGLVWGFCRPKAPTSPLRGLMPRDRSMIDNRACWPVVRDTDWCGEWDDGSGDTTSNTMVDASSTSVTILSANSSRKSARITNNGSAILYILLEDGTATLTNFSVLIPAASHYDVPDNYQGKIVGVWPIAATGEAAVMEMT